MPNWEDMVELWKQIYGNRIAGLLLIGIGNIATIWLGLWLISQIIEIWKNSILPIFYNESEKRRNRRRKNFAQHLENEINIINSQENWKDYRFTELEAEVEAEGLHSISSLIPFIKREYKGIKREKTLSKALKTSKARLILLEGDPGSGKSIALRHLTLRLIQTAKKSYNNNDILPIYINLRGIKRTKNQKINRDLILQYVLDSMNRLNDRDVDRFLEDEFEKGLHEGSWIFLFDSFDEIPDVLSAREMDSIIRKYADAISDFLHGFNHCRGIVASRYFRGPGHVDWPRFNIVGLTSERQIQLIKKADLPPNKDRILIGQLATANSELQGVAANPLFLEMIIEHVKSGHEFPENVFSIFETYTEKRFEQDSERIKKRFNIKPQDLKKAAKIIAFCMTADSNLGLSPYRNKIKTAIDKLNLSSNITSNLDKYFDALEFVKIGRSEIPTRIGEQKSFSFSHRRFQEYFATSFVLQEPNRVSASQLIADPRWRETTVVLCQVWQKEDLESIISEASKSLYNYAVELEKWNKSLATNEEQASVPWPTGSLYLLSLLQDGFSLRRHFLPEHMRINAAVILDIAQAHGIFPDKKWSLEVAGIALQDSLLSALRSAITNKSNLINSVAYKQISRLEDVPKDIANWVRKSLLEKAATLRLYQERYTTQAFLSRLPKNSELLNSFRTLLFLPTFDIIMHLVILTLIYINWNDWPFQPSDNPPAALFNIFAYGIIPLTMPLISYMFTYVILDDSTAPLAITPHTFSFFIRISWVIMGVAFVGNSQIKIALLITGFFLLAPISTIVLIADGKSWSNNLKLFFTPIEIFISAIYSPKSQNSSSRRVVIGILIVSVLLGVIGSLTATKILDKVFNSITFILILFGCSMPVMIIALTPVVKNTITRRQNLKKDKEKFSALEKKLGESLTGEEFLIFFLEFNTLDYIHQFIIVLSQKGLLQKGQVSEQALKLAIQKVETSFSEDFQRASTIDDMCILLERIQNYTSDQAD